FSARPSLLEQVRSDVHTGDNCAGARGRYGQVASAAGNVEHLFARLEVSPRNKLFGGPSICLAALPKFPAIHMPLSRVFNVSISGPAVLIALSIQLLKVYSVVRVYPAR